MTVPAADSESLSVNLSPFLTQFKLPAVAEVAIDQDDDLAGDNRAQVLLIPPQRLNTLVVTELNPILEKVLATEEIRQMSDIRFESPEWLKSKEFADAAQRRNISFYIFDRCSPPTMPLANTLFIDQIPTEAGWTQSEPQFPAPILVTSKTHPLTANLSLQDVLILEARKLEGPVGSSSLIESTFGTMMAVGPRREFEDIVIGFPLYKLGDSSATAMVSNWHIRPSFPTFFHNVFEYFSRSQTFQIGAVPLQPGRAIDLNAEPNSTIHIAAPDGQAFSMTADQNGMILFDETDQLGTYQRVTETEKQPIFTVNLSSSSESDIRTRESIDVSYREIAATPKSTNVRRDFWPWVVFGIFVVVGMEWWIFNRRLKA